MHPETLYIIRLNLIIHHNTSLGWWWYIRAAANGVTARHPCVVTLHAILLLCIVEWSQKVYIILHVVIYTICSHWERPSDGEADGVRIPPIPT